LPASRRFRTVAELLRLGERRLAAARLAYGHGTTNAAQEAAWLVAHALGLPPDRLRLQARVSPSRQARALRLIERRIAERKPAAYLAREAWLAGLRFHVDERVIVPRSHIAGLLTQRLSPWIRDPAGVRTALDLCTGSGCLAIHLARRFPRARVDAADISRAALEVARRNVRRYRLAPRVRLIESDLFDRLRGRRYDLIVCNPPYVTAAALRRLPREYRHEPRIALAGGRDGLALVRRIVAAAAVHLNPAGLLVVEVGAGRARTERTFRDIELLWPETPCGHPVFIAERAALDGLPAERRKGRSAVNPRRQGGGALRAAAVRRSARA
jgi:ribosomal protein L3 glutamine methyltransferase